MSFMSFYEKVMAAKDGLSLKKNEECFFRGHTSTNHVLIPSLFRGIDPKMKVISYDRWYAERDSFYEFRSRAKEAHLSNFTDWDILFLMQHHLVPTRLLDWTEHFNVALFFALLPLFEKKEMPQDFTPCIWLLNPYAMNEKFGYKRELWEPENIKFRNVEIKDRGDNENKKEIINLRELYSYGYSEAKDQLFKDVTPIAIYPSKKGDRITAQGGYFTLHKDDIRPLEMMLNDESILCKLEIPNDPSSLKQAVDFLMNSGTHFNTLFPDLDGLSKFLNYKYYIR